MNIAMTHIPVLLHEAVSEVFTSADGIYVDATFGRGSHARALLQRLSPRGRLIAFDKDPEAIAFARMHFAHDPRFMIVHHSFANMENVLRDLNLFGKVTGILFDLGVSSPQLDNPDRGFSFMREGDLDMRMDTSRGQDAKTWLSQVDEVTLAHVLWQYGEERCSRRIARAIVATRTETPILTTLQLADVIAKVMPKRKPHDKHPATRSFQAIRIAINQELTDLEQALQQAKSALAQHGRLAVISFHSLEDRMVKQFIRRYQQGETLPRGLPIKNHCFQAELASLGKSIKPQLAEIEANPRARSAILRIAEKQI